MSKRPSSSSPEVSIIIPVYNEENLLETAVLGLIEKLKSFSFSYELLLAENGSSDATGMLVDTLSTQYKQIKALHYQQPDYGNALKNGILAARGKFIVCDEIDLGDMDFYQRSLELLQANVSLVVGSKRHPQSRDNRPWIRRQATTLINSILHLTVGFSGTDTHGIKAFCKQDLLPIVTMCELTKDLFASELVIRTQQAGLEWIEIPVELKEIRPPSIHLLKRVPRVGKDLTKLIYSLKLKN